ncbi:FecR family protein [Pedobacter heparinus]|uniref:FecR family protein n=1 Tax=Pedobacter heparinus TaxID=984 RepID=UPI00292EC467|nr:FecR domain-containing protein [Pedobacter heparinus]
MENNNARDLLKRYAEGKCSPEEAALVETYYNQFKTAEHVDLTAEELEQNLAIVWDRLAPQPEKPIRLWQGLAAAVALVLLSGSIFFYLQHPAVPGSLPHGQAGLNDVAPGSAKAILTLADGTQIALTDAGKGLIAKQGAVQISKGAEGDLIYGAGEHSAAEPLFNTIETPKGGEFQVRLPDGTKVWLNAASSLKYPTVFSGHERSVVLTGEAYFEVSPDKSKPFKVLTAGQEVAVLGTHFNINAYREGGTTRTTLLEGSVKVRQLDHANVRLLKPGQLALLQGNSLQVRSADVESELAWKNGYFIFNEEGIQAIMQKISRWYDIEVVYSPDLLDMELKFGGIVSRNKPISVVLKTMERTGKVHFKLERNRVTVLPDK